MLVVRVFAWLWGLGFLGFAAWTAAITIGTRKTYSTKENLAGATLAALSLAAGAVFLIVATGGSTW